MAIRIDANGAWTVDEAIASLARSRRPGSSCARSRSTASSAIAAVARVAERARSRSTRPPRSRGRCAPARRRRRLPEDLRCGGITGLLRRGRAGPRRRLRGLPRLDPRRPAGDRRGAARGARDRARPPVRARDAGLFADRPDPLPARDGQIALANGSRPRRRAARLVRGPAAPLEPPGDHARHRPRRFEVHGVAGAAGRPRLGSRRRSAAPSAPRSRGTSRRAPRRSGRRASSARRAGPTATAARPCRARAARAPARPACSAGGPRGQPPGRRRAGRRARACAPSARRTPRSSSARARSASASSSARRARPLGGVREPGARADQHEPLDALGQRERDVERDPPAHRVAARA